MRLFESTFPAMRLQWGLSVLSLFTLPFFDYSALWFIAAAFMYFVYICLGTTVTFHRYIVHKSFKMNKWVARFLTIVGTLGGTGSSVAWTILHTHHHKHSDTEKDPHGPSNGFWRSVTLQYRKASAKSKNVIRIARDPFHGFLHRYYSLIHIIWGTALYLIGGYEWLMFLYLMPMAFTATMAYTINHFCHQRQFGFRTHNTADNSSNVPIIAYLTFGDGWHNNHHARPGSAKFAGDRWWEVDMSWWVIKLLKKTA